MDSANSMIPAQARRLSCAMPYLEAVGRSKAYPWHDHEIPGKHTTTLHPKPCSLCSQIRGIPKHPLDSTTEATLLHVAEWGVFWALG